MSFPSGGMEEEERKMARLRRMVDRTSASLRNDPLSDREAQELIENTRRNVLALFPDKEEEFERIYRSRFERLMQENRGVQCDRALQKADDKEELE